MIRQLTLLFSLLFFTSAFSQNISLYTSYLGNYDFTMIGNTMNLHPNGTNVPCVIGTSSSATLTLDPTQNIVSAFLYWGGSGSTSQFDFDIKLNGVDITHTRTFTTNIAGRAVTGAFADVTSQVQTTGNGVYTVSDFDLSGVISTYCGNGTNFGGWSILVVYEDPDVQNNLVNIYDGFVRVDSGNPIVEFQLENLNVLNLVGNKIAYLAYEGDENIAVNESLKINGNIVSDPPLNPAHNVFNGTNSFTGSNTLYNMDLDMFNINDYTSLGDNVLTVSLQSYQDAVIIHNIALVLNSEVPDATIEAEVFVSPVCDERDITVDYVVSNIIATAVLPGGTPIAFYADDQLVGMSATVNDIPIGGSEAGSIVLSIPETIPATFTLKVVVDDDGEGNSTVIEYNEDNNEWETGVTLGVTPTVNNYDPLLEECDTHFNGTQTFDLTMIGSQMLGIQANVIIRYYADEDDAIAGNNNNIPNPTAYTAVENPQTIYVRMEDTVGCYTVASFEIQLIPQSEMDYDLPNLDICSEDEGETGLIFDLTLNNTAVLNGNDPLTHTVSYYLDQTAAQNGLTPIVNPGAYPNITNPQTVWARLEDQDGCVEYGSFELIVTPSGLVSYEIPVLYACALTEDETGVLFNLPENIPGIMNGASPDGHTITYHLEETDAMNGVNPIGTPEAYPNISNPQTIWARIVNMDNCVQFGPFDLSVLPVSLLDYEIDDYELCSADQILIGIPTDLTAHLDVILDGADPADFEISFHHSESEARNGTGAINNPGAYPNQSSPETFWIRLLDEEGCVTVGSFELIYNPAPWAEDAIFEECGFGVPVSFDLEEIKNMVVPDPTGLEFEFYLSYADAENQNNPLPILYTPPLLSYTIYVRIIDGNGCYTIVSVELNTTVNTASLDDVYRECDEAYKPNDGVTEFDLTSLHLQLNQAFGLGQSEVSFYTDLDDAVYGVNAISNPSSFENTSNPQTIYARVEGHEGAICGGIVDFEIEVLPVPEFELDDYVAFCDYDVIKSYKFFGDFDSYTWTDEDGNIVGTSNEVVFPSEGIYTLRVTSSDLECPATREIEVIFDEAPVILEIFVDGNTIKITSTGGEPPVQYSFDNGLTWYPSTVLYDIPGGVYDLLARSKYGCISKPVTFGVLGVPNVITPNDDGKNDTWQIRGVSEFPNAHIKIFDRFGKMFVDRPLTTSFQWDGKYMGRTVPSGDYWYLIILEDGRKIAGHISVRNQ